jgi:hypothetical protein
LKGKYGILISVAVLGILLLAGCASAAVDFPANEAGISAYVKAKTSITLSAAKSSFATIERETPNYIIGTVALSLHKQEECPLVYVSTDGWIVAYYPKERPSSWLFPWADYNGGPISSTTLSKAVGIVASAVGGSSSGLKYYDFRNPGATKMILIANSATNQVKYFKVTIPSSYSTYVIDWSHYHQSRYYDGYVYRNGAQVSHLADIDNAVNYGSFTGQFVNGVGQNITVKSTSSVDRVGLVLEYAE